MSAGSYRTVFVDSARAEIRQLPKVTAMAILGKLTELETDPYAFGSTALVTNPSIRRVRVGSYRVLYTVDRGKLVVAVVQVAHRSVIY